MRLALLFTVGSINENTLDTAELPLVRREAENRILWLQTLADTPAISILGIVVHSEAMDVKWWYSLEGILLNVEAYFQLHHQPESVRGLNAAQI